MSTAGSNNKLKGIVFFARHGDRTAFYQDPTTYTASDTTITPLGEVQEFNLGSLLRSTYLTPGGAKFIQGINYKAANQSEIKVRADAGDEGGVIFDSCIALLQGLFPPNRQAESITLANGTTFTSPLGGYEYIPIESVESNEDISLEGHASCTNWSNRVNQIYQSPAFLARAQQAAPFLAAIKPFIDDRPDTAINAYNIFDFVNVESIHNRDFLHKLPPTLLAQALDLANFHEWITFTDPTRGGIGNIDAYTFIPSVLNGLSRVANASDPLKIHYSAISYKPFISLFNLTAADPINHPVTPENFGGIVDYASAVVLEVYEDNSLKARYKNGTHAFVDLALNSSLSTVSGFTAALAPLGINNTLQWCNACGNHVDRGCAAFFGGSSSLAKRDFSSSVALPSNVSITIVQPQRVDPLAAGFIGAFTSLAFSMIAFIAMVLLGVIGFKTRGRSSRNVNAIPVQSRVDDMVKVPY